MLFSPGQVLKKKNIVHDPVMLAWKATFQCWFTHSISICISVPERLFGLDVVVVRFKFSALFEQFTDAGSWPVSSVTEKGGGFPAIFV